MRESAPQAARVSRTTTRVRYPETDRMGVAHHTHYFTWFELGRTELMRDAGCTYRELEEDGGVYFPVIEAGAVYKASARYDEVIDIETRLVAAEGVRVRFEYTLRRPVENRILATGYTVHASCGADGKPIRLPDTVRQRLTAGELEP